VSALVQISRREGEIRRVKYGVTPVIELHLEPHERVVSVELTGNAWRHPERKTVDWQWVVFVAAYLGAPLPSEGTER